MFGKAGDIMFGGKKPTRNMVATERQIQIMMGMRVNPKYTVFREDWAAVTEMMQFNWLKLNHGNYELTELGKTVYLSQLHKPKKKISIPVTYRQPVIQYNTTTYSGARAMVQEVTIKETHKSLRSHIWTMEELRELDEAEEKAKADLRVGWFGM